MRSPEERAEHKSAVQQHLNSMRQADRVRGQADVAKVVAEIDGTGGVRALDKRAYARFKTQFISTLRRA